MTASGADFTLITGASTGIGLELAKLFAAARHSLILTARKRDVLELVAAQLRQQHAVEVHVIPADLADPSATRSLFTEIQRRSLTVDILINNAGFGTHGEFYKNDPAQELGLLQVNIVSLVHFTRLFLPAMIQRGHGKILNVASTAAFQPGPLMANYYASKAYVLSFSQALSNELRGSGVTVTALCPGPTATEFQQRAGIRNSKLFQATGMTAAEVALAGYRGLLAGKSVVIPGFKNRLLASLSRITPSRAAMMVVRKLNNSR